MTWPHRVRRHSRPSPQSPSPHLRGTGPVPGPEPALRPGAGWPLSGRVLEARMIGGQRWDKMLKVPIVGSCLLCYRTSLATLSVVASVWTNSRYITQRCGMRPRRRRVRRRVFGPPRYQMSEAPARHETQQPLPSQLCQQDASHGHLQQSCSSLRTPCV